MPFHLTASAGPLLGRKFTFDSHDFFLLERTKTMHSQLGDKEKYVSRIQFVVEINPPRGRVVDMGNPSGTFVNNKRVNAVELHHLDEIHAGHTYLRVEIPGTTSEMPRLAPEQAAMPQVARGMPEIPGYRLESELGHGPLGTTYLAAREDDEAVVAIKTYVAAGSPDRDVAMAFLNDVAPLRDLEHPHIVPVRTMGIAHGVCWFEMDAVTGPDLGKVIKEHGPMDEQVAVRIMLQVLSALEHAHEHQIGHSGLKPSNVFLEEQGDKKRTVKVSDFGLAQAFAMSPMSGLTVTDHLPATVDFIAPEQIAHFRDITTAIDQFRAAATLYRLLTDKSPYNFAPPVHALAQVLDGAVVPLRSRRRDLTPELTAVVERAMSREPGERYPDIQSFAEALLPFAK